MHQFTKRLVRNGGTYWLFLVVATVGVGVVLIGAPPSPPEHTEAPVDPRAATSSPAPEPESTAADGGTSPLPSVTKETPKWAPAAEPKPLTENVKRGLMWLVEHQHQNGGWSQGEESQHMRGSMKHLTDKPNVGDTCTSLLALLRSGSTPSQGDYAKNILSGLKYLCAEIMDSDDESLFVTKTRGTRLQMKLGTYIDTFLASMVLAEVKGKMPDETGEKMVFEAFHKVADKIERNQRPDGTFGGTGWANVLSLSMASKGVNRIVQNGGDVSEVVRDRLEGYAARNFDKQSSTFSAEGSAGVSLYAGAANLSVMQDSDNTNGQIRDGIQQKLSAAKTDEERKKAQQLLERFDRNADNLASAQGAIINKLDDERFIAGFGSNGGEEFLSYMNIGESLVVKGGPDWEKWDKKMTANLNRIQNKDGSWTGHHCITGRNFCTAAALLVLMTDRAPVPVAARIRNR